jgi:hypothetical protein
MTAPCHLLVSYSCHLLLACIASRLPCCTQMVALLAALHMRVLYCQSKEGALHGQLRRGMMNCNAGHCYAAMLHRMPLSCTAVQHPCHWCAVSLRYDLASLWLLQGTFPPRLSTHSALAKAMTPCCWWTAALRPLLVSWLGIAGSVFLVVSLTAEKASLLPTLIFLHACLLPSERTL